MHLHNFISKKYKIRTITSLLLTTNTNNTFAYRQLYPGCDETITDNVKEDNTIRVKAKN